MVIRVTAIRASPDRFTANLSFGLTLSCFAVSGASMRGKLVPDLLAVLHDKSDSLQFVNIRDGITRDGHHIGKFARFDRADAVLPAQHFRGVGCDCTNHIERW